MSYQEAAFYFMSGTGNSYRVASWLGEACRRHGLKASVTPILRGKGRPLVSPGAGLIGLTMPTHGFTAPWLMICFALGLPRGKGTHAMVMPTRAGTKFGPLFLPGMMGTAGYLIALILILKGYDVRGVIAIDMPSNWTSAHWGLNKANSAAIIARAQVKVLEFMEFILEGKRRYRGFVELAIGLAILPVSLGYMLFGRVYFAKMFFASDSCTGCGICAGGCPVQAIRMWGGKPYWTYKCESCMRCMNFCPVRAVEASHPMAVGFFYITNIPIWEYVLNKLGGSAVLALSKNGLVAFVLHYSYFIVSVSLTYLLFFLLNRIPAVSRLFALTTLTNYYRRYHEPDTSLRDLSPKSK